MAKSPRSGTAGLVWELCEPVAQQMGLILWDVRFLKEGISWVLRIFIDREDGVTVDDCEAFSRAIDPLLDEKDPISQSYCLEVSSPGTERELSLPFHFDACMGEKITVRLIRPRDGQREFVGILENFEDGMISIRMDSEQEPVLFSQKDVALCRLVDDYFGG